MGMNKLVPCSWYLRGPSDRNVSHDSTVAFCYSFSESTLLSAETDRGPLPALKLHLKAKSA